MAHDVAAGNTRRQRIHQPDPHHRRRQRVGGPGTGTQYHGRTAMTSEADVRRICLSLPETIEKPYEGRPGFRVKDKLFARLRERPDALVVWQPAIAEKEALIASEPHKF